MSSTRRRSVSRPARAEPRFNMIRKAAPPGGLFAFPGPAVLSGWQRLVRCGPIGGNPCGHIGSGPACPPARACGALDSAPGRGDLVVSMVPADMHADLARHCIGHGAHFLWPGHITPELAALDTPARRAGSVLLGEIGVEPGIDHLMAHDLVKAHRHLARPDEPDRVVLHVSLRPEAEARAAGADFPRGRSPALTVRSGIVRSAAAHRPRHPRATGPEHPCRPRGNRPASARPSGNPRSA